MSTLQKMLFVSEILIIPFSLLTHSTSFADDTCPALTGTFLCKEAIPYWTNDYNQVTLSQKQNSTSDPSLFEFKFIVEDKHSEDPLMNQFSWFTDGVERPQRDLTFSILPSKAHVSTSAACVTTESDKTKPSLVINETWTVVPLDENQNETQFQDGGKLVMNLKYTLQLTPEKDLLISLKHSSKTAEAGSDQWAVDPEPYEGSSLCQRIN